MKQNIFLIVFLFCCSPHSFAQQPDASLPGAWKGTSICQVKNSPCHDEVVVYHITNGKKSGEYTILANKIINGAEEEMGTIQYVFDEKQKELTGSYRSDDIWKFKLNGNKLDGTLYLRGVLYRIINLQKLD